MKTTDFQRGVLAAAAVAANYNSSTTHPYRLDDCISCKLNVIRRAKPRKNKQRLQAPTDAWLVGVATALAEMHRTLIAGGDGAGVRRVASGCGLTLVVARRVGVSAYDLRELRKAGVP
jgi:hypothetical protein